MIVTGVAGRDAAQLVAAITLVTGLLFIALALLRMGWIARFLSRAVITGFLAGAAGATLRLARVKPQVLKVLEADGLLDVIGRDHVHGNVYRAVQAQLAGRMPA